MSRESELYQCPYSAAVKCAMDEPCKVCEIWSEQMYIVEKPAKLDQAVAVVGHKPFRFQVVVHDGMVSVETPGLKDVGDFYYSGLFGNANTITGHGLQANHKDPEWPEMKSILVEVAESAIKAWVESQRGSLQ